MTPRLGFLGVGWIGRHRLEGLVRSGAAGAAAIADPSEAAREAARTLAPAATLHPGLDTLLEDDLDGVVIATPSAGHARQAIRVLERGLPVFCQKPLGRDAREVDEVLRVAREVDRAVEVDLSYRHVAAVRAVRKLVRSGALGRVYAADLVFHNAYGPDGTWYYDPELSGGGCVMDLGIHLVDLLLWVLDARVGRVDARLRAGGRRLSPDPGAPVEDFAEIWVDLDGDRHARIACSWKLHAGEDASIRFDFHGTGGGARARNVGGSFYDFRAEHLAATGRNVLVEPPDAWGARALVAWARRIAAGQRAFDPSCEHLLETARVLDAVYAAGRPSRAHRVGRDPVVAGGRGGAP